MNHVIEIKDFYERLRSFILDKEQLTHQLSIRRYFECLGIDFLHETPYQRPPGLPSNILCIIGPSTISRATGDILPRIEGDRLAFQCNTSLEEEGNEETEKALNHILTEFFTNECNQNGVAEFLEQLAARRASKGASEAVKALFFIEPPDTLFLRISG